MYINLYTPSNHHYNKINYRQIGHYFFNLFLIIVVQLISSYLIFFQLLKPKDNLIARAAIISPVADSNAQVLSAQSENKPEDNIPQQELSQMIKTRPVASPVPEPSVFQTYTAPKSSYKIVVFGDSMVDTAGEVLEYYGNALRRKYPATSFEMYNFGKGSETVSMGLSRFHQGLQYKDRSYPPIDEIRPDIIILGSFGYNPYTPPDADKHWVEMTKMVEEAKSITPNVYLMAEIAPLRNNFGKGPAGVNWDTNTAYTHSGNIIAQLQGTVGLAKQLGIGLIDAYNPSIITGESGGNPAYINPGDGIHPSVAGFEFMANIVVKSIKLN